MTATDDDKEAQLEEWRRKRQERRKRRRDPEEEAPLLAAGALLVEVEEEEEEEEVLSDAVAPETTIETKDAPVMEPELPPPVEETPQELAATTANERRQNEEARILREASKVQANALQAASELATGVQYNRPMPSTWKPPRYILEQGPARWQAVRDEWHMVVEGTQIPPPLKRFVDMKFPPPILEVLNSKGIKKPTPIQMQGLPVALAGRDMVGIAFTGSGKTLSFSLPLVIAALEEELRMPLAPGEGPVGIILAPSRELARQTFELVEECCNAISQTSEYPQLRSQLMIGGESARDQLKSVQNQGLHCLVATPGRLRDVLKRKALTLNVCRFIVLDEADRLIDMGFDEEVGEIMNYFPHQRQTLLYSATFPKKFQDFCRNVLVQPIVVNVGRAGAANLDVIQEVEFVKEEAKVVYLLHCLQKTAPPVIIFCERKGAADDIHEYLLLKGVEAVSIHGGKDQLERNEAIKLFKEGKKDVLIATDIAAKGLDFPDIQHVINFDMPEEIENYVHRIGRTGRCGKTGVATTFINRSCEETTLLDLKALLKEARQRIPPVLLMLEDPRGEEQQQNGGGCSFCGGLGHSIVDCPKIDKDARRVAGNRKDVLAGGGDW
jgi:ATP-dependent RNA helicase DDX41